jgi:ATP-dependent Clp protease ATP-binding subunit ClpB
MSEEAKQKAVTEALREHFRPEFLNRIDEVVIYHSLGQNQIAGIVQVQLDLVAQRLKSKKIGISFSKEAVDFLARKGYDPIYGARPLKRVIQTELLNPLSKQIISGNVKAGDTVEVKADANHLTF